LGLIDRVLQSTLLREKYFMQTKATARVKGARYYQAFRLFQQGLLKPGADIRLERQPDNHMTKTPSL